MEGLLDTMVIGEYEDRKVANFDVPGAYPHTDLPKENFTLGLLEGRFGDIICDINHDYKQHVRFKDWRYCFYIFLRQYM